jgi:hypothetical protein
MRPRTTAAEWFAFVLIGTAAAVFLVVVVLLAASLAGDPHPWSPGLDRPAD